jgi:P4 family phage/plasmid primase-like protien
MAFIDINTAGIPPALKQLDQWVLWRRTETKEHGRFGKQPIHRAGYPVSATEPKNWLSFNTAVADFKSSAHAAGLGFCLSGQPVDTPNGKRYLVGIDIDLCVTPASERQEAELTPEAEAILQLVDSYAELSPSGTGVRAFFYSEALPTSRNSNGKELYGHGRFLTVTGVGRGEMRCLSPAEVEQLVTTMFGAHSQAPKSNLVSAHQANAFTAPAETPQNVDKLKTALAAIPAGISRDQWVRVVLSVKAHGFSCGEALARAWSESAGDYDAATNRNGYEAKAFDDVWRCAPNSISPGTLYFFAKQYGSNTQPIAYGDTFNGQVFAELHRGQLRYVYPAGRWIRWNGMRWEWCGGHEALEAAKRTAQEVLKRAAEDFQRDPSNAEAKRKLTHGQQSFNLKRLEPMLVCAAAEADMHVAEMAELDADPMLLGCRNGVLDLRIGQLLWPQLEMLITKQVDAEYHRDAPCPLWERFLLQVMLEDDETILYLQKAIGYTLTGLVSEEVMHFAYGGGRNGKSVLANILRRLFNDYAVVAPAEMLMLRDRGGGANNDIARLVGARLLLANETRSGQALDDLTLKTLVSTENISARFLHKEYFEFKPTHHIWMRGNHKPMVRDESEGAWRRIRLLPFELDLKPDEVDPQLEDKLWAERDGILAWAVRGCMLWQKEGLTPSPRIKSASAGYRKDCDLFGEYIEEQCVLDKAARIGQRILWQDYQQWCQDNGVKFGSKKAFTRRLEDRGVVPAGWQGKERMYSGIRQRTAKDNAEAAEAVHHAITGSSGVSGFSPIDPSLRTKNGDDPTSCEVVVEGGAA